MALLLNAGNTVSRSYSYTQPSPLHPIQPQECGERTGNLFDKNGVVLVGNGSVINILPTGIKTIIETAGSNRYSSIRLDNELLGKTITISSTITQSANNKGQIRLFYVNGRYATSSITAITTAGQTGYITSTYTMPSSIPSGSDGIAIVLSADRNGDGNIGDYVEYADLMIVEGSTAPSSYIPFGIKIPILNNSQTTNVYLGELQSTRRIKKLVLTGEEQFIYASQDDNRYVCSLTDSALNMSNAIGVCSHLVWKTNYDTSDYNRLVRYSDTLFFLSLANNLLDEISVNGFKTYLAQQYAAGTPVTVWYVLATPQTAVVNEPIRKIGDYADTVSGISIPTIAGENTLSIGTTLQPSEVTATYKGWHPVQSVHERENGAWD